MQQTVTQPQQDAPPVPLDMTEQHRAMQLEYHRQLDAGELQTRDIEEFRFDGENTITGIVMRYGDTSTFPWGDKERFDMEAFGDVAGLDLILNVQHQRDKCIARTNGGGLTLTGSATQVDLRAELDEEDTDAANALRKVKRRILRGLSVEFRPLKVRQEGSMSKGYTNIIEKAELRGIAIVDRPQYKQSTLREEDMDEVQTRRLIEEALETRAAADGTKTGTVDNAALARAMTTAIKAGVDDATADIETRMTAAVESALQKRSEAEAEERAAKDKADEEERAKVAKEEEERMGGKHGERGEADMDTLAANKAELMTQVRELVADDFEFRGKSDHEILVAAVGDEVKDAGDKSADYLRAKVEGILELRAKAQGAQRTAANVNNTPQGQQPGMASATGAVNVLTMRRPTPGSIKGQAA